MEQALVAVQLVFFIMGGLGLFFTGIGVLWFVTVYKEKCSIASSLRNLAYLKIRAAICWPVLFSLPNPKLTL